MRKGQLQKGFTIVELIMYVGMLSILMGVLTTIFASIIDTQLESESLSSVQQDGRYISARLFYDINRAQTITTPTLGNQGSNLQITIGGISYSYTVDGNGNLVLTENALANVLNGYNTTVSNVTFRHVGNVGGKNTIQASFMVTSKVADENGNESNTFTVTAGVR